MVLKKIKNEVINFKKIPGYFWNNSSRDCIFAVFTNIDDKEWVILHRSTNPSLQMLVLFYSSKI